MPIVRCKSPFLNPLNVGTNSRTDSAVRPLCASSSEMVENDAPGGTVTFSCEVEAAVTVARVAPKLTKLFSGCTLKFDPLIVISAPTGAVTGEKDVITGFDPV